MLEMHKIDYICFLKLNEIQTNQRAYNYSHITLDP